MQQSRGFDAGTYPNLTESANLQDKINYVQPAVVVGKAYDPSGITSQVFGNLNKTPKVTNYSGNTNGTSRNYHYLEDNKTNNWNKNKSLAQIIGSHFNLAQKVQKF